MKLGYKLRKLEIGFEYTARRLLNVLNHIIWVLFSPYKFGLVENKKIKNLLVSDVGGGIGDIVNTVGVINSFKKANPQVNIYFHTQEKFLGITKNNPNIQMVCTNLKEVLPNMKVDAAIMIATNPEERKLILKKTRKAVFMQVDSLAANLQFYAFLSLRKRFPRYYHWTKRRINCFEMLGFKVPYKLELISSSEDKKKAKEEYKKLNPKNKKIVLFGPGAGTIDKALNEGLIPSHDWPAENFSKLADRLIEEHDCLILIAGTKNDEKWAKQIISNCKEKKSVKSVCGRFSIIEFEEFMRLCDLLVSVDTGTVHIATQAGIPVIDLMGPYPPKLYCAWAPAEGIEDAKAVSIYHPEACSGCRKYYCPEGSPICMKRISPDEVFDAAENLMT